MNRTIAVATMFACMSTLVSTATTPAAAFRIEMKPAPDTTVSDTGRNPDDGLQIASVGVPPILRPGFGRETEIHNARRSPPKSDKPGYSPRVVDSDDGIPKGGGHRMVGKPYTVKGKTYVPRDNPYYDQVGMASWYGDDFQGRLTANGEVYDMNSLSAAHPTLPLPIHARVTNLENGRTIIVRINDRGPFHGKRIIDLSQKSASLLGFKRQGTAEVRVQYLGKAPLDGSDDDVLEDMAQTNDRCPNPKTQTRPELAWLTGTLDYTPLKPLVAGRTGAPKAVTRREATGQFSVACHVDPDALDLVASRG